MTPAGQSGSLQRGLSGWDNWWATNKGKEDNQVHHQGWQWQVAQYPHSRISLHTSHEEMPSITTTFGVDCAQQEDMDGEVWWAAFCFGKEAKRPFPSVPWQMFQLSTQLLFWVCTNHLPQQLKPVRPHSSRGRQSFKFLDARFWGRMSRSHFKKLWLKRIPILAIENGYLMTRSTKMTRPFTHPVYLTHLTRWLPLTSPFAVGPLFLIHHHQLLWMKTPPLLPLMTKLNWCNGTTVWATSPSKSWSSSPLMVRYPRNCQNSSSPSVLVVYLAQWPSYLGVAERWHLLTKSLLPPSQGR